MSSTSLPFGITAIRHEFVIPLGPRRSLPRWVSSFVVPGNGWVAVDAGVRGAAAAILDVTGGELSTLLLTHAHPDHLGGAKTLCDQSGCTVAAAETERGWIETPEVQLAERPVPGFWQLVEGGVGIDSALADGCRASPDLEVIATPGHSPGHLSFWDPNRRVLFAGDAIPVPGEMPIYDDAQAATRSLERLRSLGPIHLLLSAWDEPCEGEPAHAAIERGLDVVRTVERYVNDAQNKLGTSADLAAMTSETAQSLGLPPQLAGPMLARTVRAHLISPLAPPGPDSRRV